MSLENSCIGRLVLCKLECVNVVLCCFNAILKYVQMGKGNKDRKRKKPLFKSKGFSCLDLDVNLTISSQLQSTKKKPAVSVQWYIFHLHAKARIMMPLRCVTKQWNNLIRYNILTEDYCSSPFP